jgi:glycosyltransferase involved in cell wall biosynthesis
MRILHVISGIDPAAGGPTTALVGLARAQSRAGLHVTLLAPWHQQGGQAAQALAAHLNTQNIPTLTFGPATHRRGAHPDMPRHIEGAIADTDIVHIHAVWEESQHQAAKIARRLRKPYLFTPHGMLDPWNLSHSRWKKRLYLALRLRAHLNHAAALHATTSIEADSLKRLGLTPPVFVEPLGIDTSEFADLPPRDAFHRAHPELANAPYILYLGRLHPGKGLELLIPAFAQAAPPDTRLVIAGPDSANFRPQLDTLIRQSSLTGRVLFTGMLRGPDKLAALTGSQLLALPSFHENFGLAVVESLAAGRPVLVSDQVQLWREITQANVGAACPTTIPALAVLLRQWLSTPTLLESAATRARPFALAHYDWNAIAKNWIEHYTRLTRHPSPEGATKSSPRRKPRDRPAPNP